MADKLRELAARRPETDFAAELSRDQVVEFWDRGFVRLDRATTDEEVAWLGEVYDTLFSGEMELPAGQFSKDGTRPPSRAPSPPISQLLYPELVFPALRQTALYRNTRRVSGQLFGADQELTGWGHMVQKSAKGSEIIYWHQDEAYWDPAVQQQGAACWMPLDPATVESGAMSFIPGSHKGRVLLHGFPDDDPSVTSVMLKEEIDTSTAVPQPVPIGGISIHHNRTLHVSGPNTTGRVRRAYVNVWNTPSSRRAVPEERPWYWDKVRWMQSRKG
jgi:hypothetical protein